MKSTKTNRKIHKKTHFMTGQAFAHLKQALKEALAFERGAGRDLNVTRVQAKHRPRRNKVI